VVYSTVVPACRAASDPTHRGAWLGTLVVFTVAGLVEGVFASHLNTFLPGHLETLGARPQELPRMVGRIIAVATAIGIPFLPLWGALADRYRRKPVILRSFVILVAAGGIMIIARSVQTFVAGRALVALAMGNTGLMLAILAESIPGERVATAFAVVNAGIPIGGFIGPPLGGIFVDEYGLVGLLHADLLLLIVVLGAVSLVIRDEFTATERRPLLQLARESLSIVTRNTSVRRVFVGITVLVSGWLGAFVYVPLAVAAMYQGDDVGRVTGLVFGASGLATLVIAPLTGVLGDRIGAWGALKLAVVLEVPLLVSLSVIRDIDAFTSVWAVASGIATGGLSMCMLLLSGSVDEGSRGRLMSFTGLPMAGGFVLGPAAASLFADRIDLFAVFPLAAGFAVVGLLCLSWAVRGATG